MRKFVIAIIGILLLSFCGCSFPNSSVMVEINGRNHEVSGFQEIEESLLSLLDAAGAEEIRLYDCSELTMDILENRQGTTIVERCIGLVTNAQTGDGKILNLPEGSGDYISYRGVYHPVDDGTVILSYMVYSPDNNYFDDIVERYDFVLDREWED